MGAMTKNKAPTDYLREAVIYTIASLMLFSFIVFNNQTDMGMFFPLLGAGILMIATGLAAMVAIGLAFFRPTQPRSRRVALVCFMALAVYPIASMLIWP